MKGGRALGRYAGKAVGRHGGRAVWALPALVLLTALPADRLTAQTDPRLVDAVRWAQEGRGDSARATVQRLLAATPTTDTLYPQIVYTQAMVANNAADMRRGLQRIVVEYGGSSWADDALLRLVQMDYATRNFDNASRNLERLRLDYPATPLIPQASYWAARTYFDQGKETEACRWLADGMARAGSDIELQNQLGYLYQRCATVSRTDSVPPADSVKPAAAPAVARADSGPPAPAPTRDTTPSQPVGPPPIAPESPTPTPSAAAPAAAPREPVYRVQIAAVATKAAADAAARKVAPLGLTVVTRQEGGLHKVRVGEYHSRTEAQNAAAGLKAKLGGTPFVVAEP